VRALLLDHDPSKKWLNPLISADLRPPFSAVSQL
jgi:hypothetical protein